MILRLTFCRSQPQNPEWSLKISSLSFKGEWKLLSLHTNKTFFLVHANFNKNITLNMIYKISWFFTIDVLC